MFSGVESCVAPRRSELPRPALDWRTQPFVFGVIDDLDAIMFTGRDPRREGVMKRVQEAWISFARTRDPSRAGLAWPKYEQKGRATMELGITSQSVSDPNSAERSLWNSLPFDGVTPPAGKMWALVWEN